MPRIGIALMALFALLAALAAGPWAAAGAQDHDQAQRLKEAGEILPLEQLLARARLAGAPAPGKWFEPREMLPALVATLQALHRERALEIALALEDSPARWPADGEDMLELLGNLLDNVCQWARRKVRLRACTEGAPEGGGGAWLVLCVEDDGPGVSKAAAQGLGRKRGRRLAEAADTPGHGLGLAIARDIVRSYGGTLDFDRSPTLGGLRATVRLPLAQAGRG
jgi:signal transduction histidine kinase